MNSMISIFLTSNGIDPFYVKAGILALTFNFVSDFADYAD